MRVLVCGSRSWTDRERLYAVLDAFHANTDPIEVVIEGGARGADRLAYQWALGHNIEAEEYAAHWRHGRNCAPSCQQIVGKAAGHIRNARMLRIGNPDAVIAFHLDDSPGTADMIALARAADIQVYVIRPETDINRPAGPVPAAARTR